MQEMQETGFWSLGREDHLEEEMATHSSILAWKIPWAEISGGLQSTGSQRVWHDWATKHAPMLNVAVMGQYYYLTISRYLTWQHINTKDGLWILFSSSLDNQIQ